MLDDEKIRIYENRIHKVVKHNDIVQKSRFKLSITEQKTVAFIISLIKPKEDYENYIQPLEYEFEMQDYCRICGIDYNAGKNYTMVRNTLKSLRDKSVIITLPDSTETSASWIAKFWTNKGSGKAKIRFDEDIIPYIFDLFENTTRYELLNILPMQSKYSIRLYELCRSWSGLYSKTYTLSELRTLLMIPDNELVRYPDFRRRVLEYAQEEINKYTDLNITFEPIKKGKKIIKIQLIIKKKTSIENFLTNRLSNDILDKSL